MLEERVIPDENNPYYLTFCLLRAMLRANGVAIAHIRLVKRTGGWRVGHRVYRHAGAPYL